MHRYIPEAVTERCSLKSTKIRNFIPLECIERTTTDRLQEIMEYHEYQHSADIFVKNIFTSFHGTGHGTLYFLIDQKIRAKGFLMFSRDTERYQCHKMG